MSWCGGAATLFLLPAAGAVRPSQADMKTMIYQTLIFSVRICRMKRRDFAATPPDSTKVLTMLTFSLTPGLYLHNKFLTTPKYALHRSRDHWKGQRCVRYAKIEYRFFCTAR